MTCTSYWLVKETCASVQIPITKTEVGFAAKGPPVDKKAVVAGTSWLTSLGRLALCKEHPATYTAWQEGVMEMLGHSGEYGNKRHLWTWKTKIQKIIDLGKIDAFSVRTNIYLKNKKMGNLIRPFGILMYKTFQKWDIPRWRKAGWMIVVSCQTHFFCNTGTILAQ